MEKSIKPFGKFCPSLGHLHVSHTTSTVCEEGRYCAKEVARLVEWLANNISYIKKVYSKFAFETSIDIKNVIIVVTPFQAQKDLIRLTLDSTAEMLQIPDLSIISCATIDEALAMEYKCRIVLFSPVYGTDDDWDYLRNNYIKINQMISWAKDYFFVVWESNDPRRLWRTSKALEEFRHKVYRFVDDLIEFPGPKACDHEDELFDIRDTLVETMRNAGYDVFDPIDRRMDPGSLENLRKAPDGDFEII